MVTLLLTSSINATSRLLYLPVGQFQVPSDQAPQPTASLPPSVGVTPPYLSLPAIYKQQRKYYNEPEQKEACSFVTGQEWQHGLLLTGSLRSTIKKRLNKGEDKSSYF